MPDIREYVKQFIKKCPCCQKKLKIPITVSKYTTSTYQTMPCIKILLRTMVVIDWKQILKEWLRTKFNWTQLHLAATALMDAEEVASLDGLSNDKEGRKIRDKAGYKREYQTWDQLTPCVRNSASTLICVEIKRSSSRVSSLKPMDGSRRM
jgi:hypothetical protein